MLLQNQTGFDGFAQSDLIRKHDARRIAARDFIGDVQLMWNQFGACATQTHQPAALGIAHQLQGLLLEIKPLARLKLAGQQTVKRAIHTQRIGQQALRQRMALALIILCFINDQP